MIGRTIGGNVRLDAVLGDGGAGTVYRATHLGLGKTVAVKVMKSALLDDETARRRFLEEPRLASSLEAEHIVRVLDANEENGVPYVVMEYIDGTDLQTLVANRGPLEVNYAVNILDQVAVALDAAHEAGIVHRDVKPGNILIDNDDQAFLTDFGNARVLRAEKGRTRPNEFTGTVEYAAPEQITADEVDARTDVYALGGVLFYCLTGRPPFSGRTDYEVMQQHVEAARPRVTAARDDLPSALDAAVAKAMAVKPQDRYGSCGELVARIRTALDRGPATKKGSTLARKQWRVWQRLPKRGRAWTVATGAVALAAAIGVAVWATTRDGGGTPATPEAISPTGSPAPPVEGPAPPVEEPAPPVEEPPAPAEEPAAEPAISDPAAGSRVFSTAGCGGCHTVADAQATGRVGPNLDDSRPGEAFVVERVTNGKGTAMPAYAGTLSEQEIRDLAAYVVAATTYPNAKEQQVLALLPATHDCDRAETADRRLAATANLHCVPDETAADDSWHFLFPTLDEMNSEYDGMKQSVAPAAESPTCPDELPGEHRFSEESGMRGRVLCFLFRDQPYLEWTREDLLVLSFARGGDAEDLWEWWQRTTP